MTIDSSRTSKDFSSCGNSRVRRGCFSSAIVLMLAFVLGCSGRSGPAEKPAVQHFLAAQEAIAAGDTAAAKESLDASIAASPTSWALFERAKLLAESDDNDAAFADCDAGLELNPDSTDFKWLRSELKKPAKDRFKGRFAEPPRAAK